MNVTWPVPQYRGVNLGGWLVLESWVRALHTEMDGQTGGDGIV